ncbi:MAG: acetyl-CoA carboxylase carboxyltransferase subunit alpha [Fusobacteria bacterium]|nr:acetyl-CoA carboxylase carboxyltransferase subunit alpha [Fusobacteriota bacterium]
MKFYLEFEQEIKSLETKLDELKLFSKEKEIDLNSEINKFEKQLETLMIDTYAKLTPWQRTQVARHPKRPYTLDYIKHMCSEFVELHGDRLFKDDHAIVGGIGKIDKQSFVIIGQQKGREVKENLYRNFGMPNPEGYRKALRLMKLAERFNLPILTLIDTNGAYPGIEAEERGQGEAIARNLMEMAGLNVPIISVIIGEGGSGGALGIGVADRVLMLENSWYSVISPEGCAAILFKDASKASVAAESLKTDAVSLKKMGIIDEIVKEPVGGAHRDYEVAANNVKKLILSICKELKQLKVDELKEKRYQKYRNYGVFTE